MGLNKDSDRGDRAKRFMEEKIVVEAFAAIEKAIEDGWKNSLPDDHDARHRAYLMSRLLANFKQQFVIAIATGKVASKKLLEIKEGKEHG